MRLSVNSTYDTVVVRLDIAGFKIESAAVKSKLTGAILRIFWFPSSKLYNTAYCLNQWTLGLTDKAIS